MAQQMVGISEDATANGPLSSGARQPPPASQHRCIIPGWLATPAAVRLLWASAPTGRHPNTMTNEDLGRSYRQELVRAPNPACARRGQLLATKWVENLSRIAARGAVPLQV